MALWVAYFRFRPGAGVAEGLTAFERRKTFEHPHQADVVGEFWVNAPQDQPQVVVVWEAEDEGPGAYYEAAWGDLFEITVARASRPVSELPSSLPDLQS